MTKALLLIIFIAATSGVGAQQSVDSIGPANNFSMDKYSKQLSEKANKSIDAIDKQTDNYLNKLEKEEMQIRRKLMRVDSSAAKRIFVNTKNKYEQIRARFGISSDSSLATARSYIPWLDSASTSLKYFTNNPVYSTIAHGVNH